MTNKNSVDTPILVAEREVSSSNKIRKNQGNRRSNQVKSATNMWVILFILTLSIAAAAAGYQIKLQQNTIDKLLLQQTQLKSDIDKLNTSLLVSDSTNITNETQIKSQLSLFDSEIRKLWDVANKRNKDWIKQNTEKLTALDSKLAEQQLINNELEQVGEKIQALQLSQQSMTQSLQQVDSFDEKLALANQTATSSMDNNSDKFIGINLAQEAIQARQVEFDSQLSQFFKQFDQVNKSIDAIDQHRLKLAQQLALLQDENIKDSQVKPEIRQDLDVLEPNDF